MGGKGNAICATVGQGPPSCSGDRTGLGWALLKWEEWTRSLGSLEGQLVAWGDGKQRVCWSHTDRTEVPGFAHVGMKLRARKGPKNLGCAQATGMAPAGGRNRRRLKNLLSLRPTDCCLLVEFAQCLCAGQGNSGQGQRQGFCRSPSFPVLYHFHLGVRAAQSWPDLGFHDGGRDLLYTVSCIGVCSMAHSRPRAGRRLDLWAHESGRCAGSTMHAT